MRKFLLTILALIIILSGFQKAEAMKYKDAINSSKPMALFVYAQWANDLDKISQKVTAMEQTYGDKYNFVYMDIANEETRDFNERYHIYPNLPYLLLFKSNGKVSRYLQKNCLMDNACFKQRLDFFLN